MPHKIEFKKKKGGYAVWLEPNEIKKLISVTDTIDEQIVLTLLSRGLRCAEACRADSSQLFRDSRGLMLEVVGKNALRREVPVPDTLEMVNFPIIRRGTPISTNTALAWVKKAGKKIGIPEISPHDLRRSVCQNALRAGIPSEMVRAWSGHQSQTNFERYYLSTSDLSWQSQEREKLEKFLF